MDLASERARIDALNLRLRDLLQERARVVRGLAKWKRAQGLPIADHAREAEMLRKVLHVPGDGFDRAALAKLFHAVFRASRELAERQS
jgi:3-deoxy-7-phosphoheptulonate synthase/chorismate mutase